MRQLSNAMVEEIIEEFGLEEEFDIVGVWRNGRLCIGHRYFASERLADGLSVIVEKEKAFTDIDYDRPLGHYLKQYKVRRGESDTFKRYERHEAARVARKEQELEAVNHEFGLDLYKVFKRRVQMGQPIGRGEIVNKDGETTGYFSSTSTYVPWDS